MPLLSTRGANSSKGFGFTAGGGGPISFDYLVVAGGGGGGGQHNSPASSAAGGGAGGYRTSFPGGTKIDLIKGTTNITVGAGGSAGIGSSRTDATPGTDSVFSTITSTGGGGGGTSPRGGDKTGGSGGGGANDYGTGGAGNTPPFSPAQGFPGGSMPSTYPPYPPHGDPSGAGGGATQKGFDGGNATYSPDGGSGTGGAGASNSITGSSVSYAGGGSGGSGGGGGVGGGGPGNSNGTANTGGGGGGRNGPQPQQNGTTGGSGIVILRCPGAAGPRISVSPGTNTKTTVGADTLLTFTVTGSIDIT